MNRTVFLIDGFNLYHSTTDARKHLSGQSTKWLDIRALCESYLHMIGNGGQLEDVYYFSALAKHLHAVDPGKVERHETLIRCLEDTDVIVELATFKRKRDFRCPNCRENRCGHCGNRLKQWEGKETDVTIAAKLFELAFTNACDTVVLMTGDTDLTPAVETTQKLFPEKDVLFALPYERHNNILREIAPKLFTIGKESYANHPFPDPYVLPSGEQISKPPHW